MDCLSKMNIQKLMLLMAAAVTVIASTGCTSLVSPISAIPAERVPQAFLAKPRANKVPIDLARLRQDPPDNYLLDKDDVLGVYIEGVLGQDGEAPPVRMPEVGSDLSPSIGFPFPVRENGTIALPLIDPVSVRGLTIEQAESKIRNTYIDKEIIRRDETKVIVTIMRERTYRVIVVRQDSLFNAGGTGGNLRSNFQSAVSARSDESSRGFVLDLPAYKNDVLHALAETGGLPGLNAKNEIKILRSNDVNGIAKDQQAVVQYQNECNACNVNPYQLEPSCPEQGNFVRIPLRFQCGDQPQFNPKDIILEDGDIIYVESRDTEVFYTGGLLGGGEFPLPRDYDLDILGAMSLAGQGFGTTAQSAGGFGGLARGIGAVPPGQLIILRKLPGNRQLPISVDINKAINDPAARLLVQPGDTLILRYKPKEELLNFSLGTFFTFGVRELFRGF